MSLASPVCVRDSVAVTGSVSAMSLSWVRLSAQDAYCKTPSDWLDQGQSDLDVPTVPDGFMREVVIQKRASCSRSVYYHYFQTYDEPVGPSVRRVALLRAAANPDDADAEDTVKGFLRSDLYDPNEGLRHSDFDFSSTRAAGATAVGAPAGSAEQGRSTAVAPPRSSHRTKRPSAVVGFSDVERCLARVRSESDAQTDDRWVRSKCRWRPCRRLVQCCATESRLCFLLWVVR